MIDAVGGFPDFAGGCRRRLPRVRSIFGCFAICFMSFCFVVLCLSCFSFGLLCFLLYPRFFGRLGIRRRFLSSETLLLFELTLPFSCLLGFALLTLLFCLKPSSFGFGG